ncbi:hypothetical protein ACF1DY_31570 [Streptomyces albus]
MGELLVVLSLVGVAIQGARRRFDPTRGLSWTASCGLLDGAVVGHGMAGWHAPPRLALAARHISRSIRQGSDSDMDAPEGAALERRSITPEIPRHPGGCRVPVMR